VGSYHYVVTAWSSSHGGAPAAAAAQAGLNEYQPRPDPGRLSASGWSEGCRIRRIAAGSTQACGP